LDGFSAARQIRVLDPHAHIIFVTSHSLPRYREIAAELQADGFVTKDNLGLVNQIISEKSSL
jgi:DNA-binding NarL/FixJ family response regulator